MLVSRLKIEPQFAALLKVVLGRSRYPQIKVGDAAPVEGLSLVDLNGVVVDVQRLLALDAAAGKLSILNFGSYT
jgi:hypothetical protein